VYNKIKMTFKNKVADVREVKLLPWNCRYYKKSIKSTLRRQNFK